MRRTGRLILVIGLLLAGFATQQPLGFPPVAQAATFTVDSTADALDANTGDGLCQTAANTCTLRAAIMQANALGGSQTITLPAGTYTLTLAGTGEDAATLGDLDVAAFITIQGAGAATTIVDGNQLDRVFQVLPVGALALQGVTVRGGLADGGGGILSAGLLKLTGTVVTANRAGGGAGVRIIGGAPDTIIEVSTISSNTLSGGISFAASGTLSITGSVIANNQGSGLVAADGHTTIASSAFTGNSASSDNGGGIQHFGGTLAVRDTTIDGNQTGSGSGGGFSTSVGATLTRVTISNNQARNGGGVASLDGDAHLVSSTVTGNTAAEAGGGIYTQDGTLLLEQTDVVNNQAGATGGGIHMRGAPTITGGTIRDNRAGHGAGIYAAPARASGLAPTQRLISGLTLRNNIATGSGGGLYVRESVDAQVTVAETTIRDNQAGENGGGIFTASNAGSPASPALTLSGVTLNGNQAASGGGIWQIQGGTLGLVNTTVSANQATGSGGGLGNLSFAQLTNVTLQGNTAAAGNGGNVFSGGGPTRFLNTIVANGTGGNCAGVGLTSQGGNLDTGTTCQFVAAGDQQNANPSLAPLANNGGPTQTHALLPGSQAIDAGTNAGCPATDQRGVARPRDGDGNGSAICDVGAYEADGPVATATPTATATATLTPTATATPALCAPRPPVRVQTSQTGPGTLTATVTLGTTSGTPTNAFQKIAFTGGTNATVETPGSPPRPPSFEYTPGPGTTATFVVRRVNPGAFTVQFTVTDACGPWQTFAGGGASTP